MLCTTWICYFVSLSVVQPQINFHHLDLFNYNCLFYHQTLDWDIIYIVEYCFRPTTIENDHHFSITEESFISKFTFEELLQMNVTIDHLLSWSSSIDLAEQYQYYIDHPNRRTSSNGTFFKCINGWFGSHCQFSFDTQTVPIFQTLVLRDAKEKLQSWLLHPEVSLTCYVHIQCDRGGSPMCLDWREVCDGRIDCLDGAQDETFCFQLEINQCTPDEYRCDNGLCIPSTFSTDFTPECLDQSDRLPDVDYSIHDSEFSQVIWTEQACSPGYQRFVCGDGKCVDDFDHCDNGRDQFFIQSRLDRTNLSSSCRMLMTCLTKLIHQNISCSPYLQAFNLQDCPTSSLVQFPSDPLLLGHIRLIYNLTTISTSSSFNHQDILLPHYICYNVTLCDFLLPTFIHHNLTCRSASHFGLTSSMHFQSWKSLMTFLHPHFRGCSIHHYNQTHFPSLLYCCNNSSKCVIKDRLLNGFTDCPFHDDESSLIMDQLINHTRPSMILDKSRCQMTWCFLKNESPNALRPFDDLHFDEICDRTVQSFPIIIDGKNHTDETECHLWPCNTSSTRCDNYWNCADGEDERDCTPSLCPSNLFECVSSYNYTLICLSSEHLGDGIFDCLGGADEQEFCRRNVRSIEAYPGFVCSNEEKCLFPTKLCDGIPDCKHHDDERFCFNSTRMCHEPIGSLTSDVAKSLCRLASARKNIFIVQNFINYPSHFNSLNHRQIISSIPSKSSMMPLIWFCHYGIPIRVRIKHGVSIHKCLCPSNYYGDLCQYQNQRIILTLQIRRIDPNTVYTFLITLFDEDDQEQHIHSYYQFNHLVFLSCQRTIKFHLLYSTRPSQINSNYSVRADVFDKTTLKSLASWHYRVHFPFLPVYPLAMALTVPTQALSTFRDCPRQCHHGQCLRYVNEVKFFCRCDAGFTGAYCNITMNCSDCSLDSICVGHVRHRPICICPINSVGPRCLLRPSCPEDLCDNGGQCLVMDAINSVMKYACVCPMKFTGIICQFKRSFLDLSIENIRLSSSYILIHTFSTNADDLFIERSIAETFPYRLARFRNTMSVYLRTFQQIISVQINDDHYLALLQEHPVWNISTSISPNQHCPSFQHLLPSSLVSLPRIRRIKSYHQICHDHPHLLCFIDEVYLCLCNKQQHASCLKRPSTLPLCEENVHCLNGATCLQDPSHCSSSIVCVCEECFFGDQCQFYSKGIGLTLADILRYELRPHLSLHHQSLPVKISAALAVIIFVIGLINSIFSLMTFSSEKVRQVGVGLYLFASSITSLLTVIIFQIKFWLFIATQINPSMPHGILYIECVLFEFILKLSLSLDSWYNACIAFERALSVYQGVTFSNQGSKKRARWCIFILPILIGLSLIHEIIDRNLFHDKDEQHSWCALNYTSFLRHYSVTILFIHVIVPLVTNISSAIFIIVRTARQHSLLRMNMSYTRSLGEQWKDHKHLVISAVILAILSLPRVLISLFSRCVNSSGSPWLYLIGYFISFIPPISIFIVFVVPSDLYKTEFRNRCRHSYRVWFRHGRNFPY